MGRQYQFLNFFKSIIGLSFMTPYVNFVAIRMITIFRNFGNFK